MKLMVLAIASVGWGTTAPAPGPGLTPLVRLTFEPAEAMPATATAPRPDGQGHALKADQGYDCFTTGFLGQALGPTTLVLRLEAWSTNGAQVGVRALCYDARRRRIASVGTGLWDCDVPAQPMPLRSEFTLPEADVDSLRLVFYRSNKLGTLWIDNVELDAMPLEPTPTSRVYRLTLEPGAGRVFVLGDLAWVRQHGVCKPP